MSFTCPRCSHAWESTATSSCPACGFSAGSATLALTAPLDPNATVAHAGPEAIAPGVPEIVGGYRLVRPVGEGGMGSVYEAEHVATGRRVALKLIRPETAASPDAVERFRREGRFASTVTHPRCVFVITADEDRGRPYIVMELMPGDTLKDLVARDGPLPPADAVARALDVIDGLEALHRRGIVHRDVKPSNCLLDRDGRVKVGDFGLALSLLAGHSGDRARFSGTPLFASPEQHRGRPLDTRTDVYSVCATLYFLLTGQAPYPGRDVPSIIARMEAEPPPAARALRPELSPALERVVMRGLERDRERRWPSLQELKLALLRSGAARVSPAGVWARFGAYLIDYLTVTALIYAIGYPLFLLARLFWPELSWSLVPVPQFNICTGLATYTAGNPVLAAAPEALYFGVLEGLFGCGLGKWLVGLRIVRAGTERPPGLPRALLRAAGFCAVMYLPRYLLEISDWPCLVGIVCGLMSWWNLGGVVLLASTMRKRNGYRGLHDFLTGTAVLRFVWPGREITRSWLRCPCPDALAEAPPPRDGRPSRLGPFRVVGEAGPGWLLGEDEALGRRVFLWVRGSDESLSPARRDANRLTRLRWLADGVEGEVRWDAFVAEGGSPLTDLVSAKKPLTWGETRTLLRTLADELAAAVADGTVPLTLTPGQVWIQPDGRVILFDMAAGAGGEAPAGNDARALQFLGDVAVVALEGRPREGGAAVRAPLPLHARALLEKLRGGDYARVEDLRTDLAALEDRPARVSRPRRLLQIAVQIGLWLATLFLMFAGDSLLTKVPGLADPGKDVWFSWLGVAAMLVALVWVALARGGPSFGVSGIVLVRRDGRRAAWWQAVVRCLLAWLQALALLLGPYLLVAYVFAELTGGKINVDRDPVLFWTPVAAGVLGVILGVWLPRRTLPDRVAGTFLVPR